MIVHWVPDTIQSMFTLPNKSHSRCHERGRAASSLHKIWCIETSLLTTTSAVLLIVLILIASVDARFALEPLDTSSPRATMESFLRLTEEFSRRYSEYRDSPSPATQEAFFQLGDRPTDILNLSRVPPTAQREVGIETFLLLWEVIARVALPNLEEIPAASTDQKNGEKANISRWRIPGTEITIARVEEGPQAGKFLFNPETVEQARRLYQRVRDLPYLRPVPLDNLYRAEQLMTGWMIPLTWVEALPDWANFPVLGLVVWKWIAELLLLGLAAGTVIIAFIWAQRIPWDGSLSTYLRRLSAPVGILLLTPLVRFLTERQINVTGSAGEWPFYLLEIAYGIAVVWVLWLTASWIAETIIASPRIGAKSLDANVIRLAARSVGILATLVLLFDVANDVGIPVYGLVAGAGVGGLAVALAARSTLENFMGALNLFADRPVRVGDLCRFDEDYTPGWRPVGRVESIGLRSTKIRQLDNTLITIPNSEFAQRQIVNLSAARRMLLNTTLGLRYETTDDQLRFVLAELRELLHAHPETIHNYEDPIRVRFVGFGDFSLNIAVRAYINASNYNEFLGIQEDILLRVMKIVNQAGTGFAFPSRTLYHTRDGGLDHERQQEAERRVKEWAAAQQLPFPDFSDEYRKQITDSLDYPPEGSPGSGN